MVLRRTLLAAFVLGATLAAPAARAALDLRKLSDDASGSVALVTLYDAAGHELGSGSGFVVSADGRLVTNHHVIEGADHATATFPGGREIKIRGVLGDDPKHDVALVQLDDSSIPPLVFGANAAVGEEIAIIGSPLGLSTTVSSGIVSAIRAEGLSAKHTHGDAAEGWGLQVTAPISPGSSGSPILNAEGRVIGVAVGRLLGGESLNFGVPIEFARALTEAAKPGAKPKPFTPRSDLWRNVGISLGVFVFPWAAYAAWARAAKAKRDRQRKAALRH